MSDLDKKLKEIVFGDTPEPFMSNSMIAKPGQIKRAFRDAGYKTGQYWYDQFEKELAGKGILYRGRPEDIAETILGCKLAAKKAASIK